MQKYHDELLQIVNSLALARELIWEQDVILSILRGLPSEYASLKQNIQTNIATVTLNTISAWLSLKNSSIFSLNRNFILVHPLVLQRRFTHRFMPPMEALFRHMGVAVDGPTVAEEQAATVVATAFGFSPAMLEAKGEG
ncbi:unnamed protein product [Cuscuta campestris]|uniref:Uncharacterized protein n=1 Tax=Cuscuta campestris TaxID=132261 RepID=A0A484MSX3_9ASTE|nr:unnamed protein product [Cuscuta campestris]